MNTVFPMYFTHTHRQKARILRARRGEGGGGRIKF
jgi:hypothetical protein